MLEKLFKFQIDNNIELEYMFKGSKIVVLDTDFVNLKEPLSFSCIDQLMKVILRLKDNLYLSKDYENVFFLNSVCTEKKSDNDEVVDNVIPFPQKEWSQIKLAPSDPHELARACLCVNNIHKPHTEQSEEYKKLHAKGFVSYRTYMEE